MLQTKKCRSESESGRGIGLKLLEDVKEGDLIMEYAGEAINTTIKNQRINEPHDNYYIMSLKNAWYIGWQPFTVHQSFLQSKLHRETSRGETTMSMWYICQSKHYRQ
jgi:hypothetical protein